MPFFATNARHIPIQSMFHHLQQHATTQSILTASSRPHHPLLMHASSLPRVRDFKLDARHTFHLTYATSLPQRTPQRNSQVNDYDGDSTSRYSDFYFLCDPDRFICTHLPDDNRYQLLPRPISADVFEQLFYVREQFFELS